MNIINIDLNIIIDLSKLKLKTFTEQDVLDCCQINNLNTDNIIIIHLNGNELTDISGIKLFKNLKRLYLNNNQIKDISYLKNLKELIDLYIGDNKIEDISVIQYLIELNSLNINYLKLKSDQIKYIKNLKNLEELLCNNGFKDMDITDKLDKNIRLIK